MFLRNFTTHIPKRLLKNGNRVFDVDESFFDGIPFGNATG